MQWFWINKRKQVVSLKNTPHGRDLARARKEGWQRVYGDPDDFSSAIADPRTIMETDAKFTAEHEVKQQAEEHEGRGDAQDKPKGADAK